MMFVRESTNIQRIGWDARNNDDDNGDAVSGKRCGIRVG